MSPEDRDDELLQEYLEGDSELSRLYRQGADEQSPASLDERILAEARRAVANKRRVVHSPFARHWMVPTSLAAVLVLAVSVVVLMPEPALESDPVLEQKARPAPAPAVVSEPAPADSLRLRKRADEDARGERAFDAAPGEPAAVGAAIDESADKSEVQRRQAQERAVGNTLQSLPAAPTAGRESEEAAAAAAPGKASEAVLHPRPTPSDAVRADPEAWLRFIEGLLDARDHEGALGNLRAFRARYPDYPLPSALAPLAAQLETQRP